MIGWLVATALALTVVYGIYEHNQISPDIEAMNMTETIFYNMFQRAIWAGCVVWVILACHWGYGGMY